MTASMDAAADGMLSTGTLARAAGVNVQTLRYYERRGVLRASRRTAAGHRRYPEHSITLLGMIKTAQRAGFSLDEIATLMTVDPPVAAIVRRRIDRIDRELADLLRIRRVLQPYGREPEVDVSTQPN